MDGNAAVHRRESWVLSPRVGLWCRGLRCRGLRCRLSPLIRRRLIPGPLVSGRAWIGCGRPRGAQRVGPPVEVVEHRLDKDRRLLVLRLAV
jgi:hypothetical protein